MSRRQKRGSVEEEDEPRLPLPQLGQAILNETEEEVAEKKKSDLETATEDLRRLLTHSPKTP